MRNIMVLTCVFVLVAGADAWGQGGGTASGGSIGGRVTDETGATLPGVTVTVVNLATGQTRTVVTNEPGLYLVPSLTPSRYSLTAELSGFSTVVWPEITVNVGAALDINLSMKISAVVESVTVVGEAPIVQSSKTDLSTVINTAQIEALPSNGRNYLDFALLTPASVENFSTTSQGVGLNIGGARAKEGMLLVDGFYNQDEGFGFPKQRYSQDAIQEFQVVSMGATAEFGRAIGGIVSAVTKSGSNDIAGSAFGFFRDKRLNEQTVLEKQRGLPKSEFDRRQYGGTLGGPIVKSRTFFFGSVERKVQNTPRDNNITAENARIIGLPPEDAGTIPSYDKLVFVMGKVNHNLNTANALEAGFVQSRWVEYNEIIQSFVTRSRALRLNGVDTAFQFKWTNVGGGGTWLHELKASYFPRKYWLDAPDVGGPPLVPEGHILQDKPPRVNITGVASFGYFSNHHDQRSTPVQAVYSSSLFSGKHALKFGADVMDARFEVARYFMVMGTYTFRSLADYLQGRYSTFEQAFSDPPLKRHHSYFSVYAQDSWAAGDRLTLNYGLRYDAEIQPTYKGYSFGSDWNNVGPRLAVAYDLTGSGRSFLKVSSGIYYDRLFSNLTDIFFSLKQAPHTISGLWQYGQPGAPVYPNRFSSIPTDIRQGVQDVWIVPDKIQVPTSGQFLVALDHAFARDLAISVSFLYNRSWDKEMPFDTNIRFDDATQAWVRIDPTFRRIRQYTFTGKAEYEGLIIEATKRHSRKFSFGGNITIARAYDTGNNYITMPDDMRYPEREWGPSADTPRVRGVVNVVYDINSRMQVSAIYRGRSGYAFDPRSGATYDLNRDGTFDDRTPGFDRNAFRGPGTHNVDARFSWTVPIKPGRLQLTVEGFNLFNRANVRTIYSTYGPTKGQPAALFGQVLSYLNPREVQLGARFTF